MNLLELKGIGKIYVSDNSIAVGIRGVDLCFNSGEFVAITGKSGSGKSTLLNVISGMDSYEEGEMLINGEPTSHFVQADWERYREEYISFIFQDYNIIDSFTVLENVELALMSIEDRSERRKRALELIERVGLTDHIRHKGSHLSGGQKQRTVIARALAKDSPIILADEPCGNLDSATTKEIIDLLHEVCENKLLIMVTHNFDEVEAVATRHIRIYDGGVESDTYLAPVSSKNDENQPKSTPLSPSASRTKGRTLRDGITLGASIYRSRPKLSVFMSLLFIVATLGVFFMTSACSSAMSELFVKSTMFTHMDGRVVFTKQNGTPITEEELEELRVLYGAQSSLHYDLMLDDTFYALYDPDYMYEGVHLRAARVSDFDGKLVGRLPKNEREVLLSVPISFAREFGKDTIENEKLYFMFGLEVEVVGISYYYDNRIEPTCYFTDSGFEVATAVYKIISDTYSTAVEVFAIHNGSAVVDYSAYAIGHSFDVPDGKVVVDRKDFNDLIDSGDYGEVLISYSSAHRENDYFYYGDSGEVFHVSRDFDASDVHTTVPDPEFGFSYCELYLSTEVVLDIANEILEKTYSQASLFFENDDAAADAAERMQADGYVAVPSFSTYSIGSLDAILNSVLGLLMLVLWVITMVFLAFFIYICSSRALEAFRSDMAIMRSMGITSEVVKTGIFVRSLFCVIPALVSLGVVALLVFTSPVINGFFTYLGALEYVFMVLAILLIAALVTKRQIGKLFRLSVKASLRGGDRV